jgi:hypothetical protein
VGEGAHALQPGVERRHLGRRRGEQRGRLLEVGLRHEAEEQVDVRRPAIEPRIVHPPLQRITRGFAGVGPLSVASAMLGSSSYGE